MLLRKNNMNHMIQIGSLFIFFFNFLRKFRYLFIFDGLLLKNKTRQYTNNLI